MESRDFIKIKNRLLQSLTNMGQPIIRVADANHKNRGELYLMHQFEGVEIDMKYAHDTLANLNSIWSRPVHLQTVLDETPTLMNFDGKEFKQEEISEN